MNLVHVGVGRSLSSVADNGDISRVSGALK